MRSFAVAVAPLRRSRNPGSRDLVQRRTQRARTRRTQVCPIGVYPHCERIGVNSFCSPPWGAPLEHWAPQSPKPQTLSSAVPVSHTKRAVCSEVICTTSCTVAGAARRPHPGGGTTQLTPQQVVAPWAVSKGRLQALKNTKGRWGSSMSARPAGLPRLGCGSERALLSVGQWCRPPFTFLPVTPPPLIRAAESFSISISVAKSHSRSFAIAKSSSRQTRSSRHDGAEKRGSRPGPGRGGLLG